MRARGWSVLAVVSTAAIGTAAAEPKPKPVDIKPFRDKLIVLTDGEGGYYVAAPGSEGKAFFGVERKGKPLNLYEQVVIGRYSDGSTGAWDLSVWAPRVPNFQPGSVGRKADGTYFRYCGTDNQTPLTEAPIDKAKTILDKAAFMTSAIIRRPHLLARDDAGVYYYVDVIRKDYGGKGYRVFVGKKGQMKQRPLTDIATDSAGDVFGTKTGDLRIVREVDSEKTNVTWVKGEKRVALYFLDPEANSVLIFKELGVYGFVGTICDHL
jgi:hypothetical protein